MDIMHFLTETDFGRCVFTTLVSMIPIIELRGGIPFGVALGLPYQEAFVSAVIGNIIPAPFIIVYIRKIFMMTGAWTGSLAAAFLDMRLRKAFPAVLLGVLTAGCIMTALTHVGVNLFS